MPGAGAYFDVTQPVALHALNKGRVSWWRNMRASGWNAPKTFRNLLPGCTQLAAPGNATKAGSSFNGSDGVLSCPGVASTDHFKGALSAKELPTAAITYAMTIVTTTTAGVALSMYNAADIWQIYTASGAPRVAINGTYVTASTTSITDGKRHRIHCTWDGATMTCYVDAHNEGSTAKSGAISYSSPATLYLGTDDPTFPAFALKCSLDSISIWNRCLSASEVIADCIEELAGCPKTINWLDSHYPAVFGVPAAAAGAGKWINEYFITHPLSPLGV